MKKLVTIILMFLSSMQFVFAAETANIKIKISGSIHDNTYFLCLPDLGCLSILAAKKGKVFPMINAVEMNTMFVTDTHTMRVYNQGLPNSCNVTVQKNQTITIYGNLETQGGDQVVLKNFHCSVS